MKKSLILLSVLSVSALAAAEPATAANAVAPIVVEETAFTYSGKAAQVADEAASDKKAGCMLASEGWTMTYFIPATMTGTKDVTVSLRTDAKDAKGYCVVGVFDKKAKAPVTCKRIRVEDYSGTTYKDLNIGSAEMNTNRYVYLSGLNPKNPEVVHYYVDKITFK